MQMNVPGHGQMARRTGGLQKKQKTSERPPPPEQELTPGSWAHPNATINTLQ